MDIKSNELEKLLKDNKTVLVEFWGSWCPPCQNMTSVLNSLIKKFDGKVTITKINIDKNPEVSFKYNINGIPSFIVFKNGKPVSREVGSKSELQLQSFIENAII